MPPGALPSSCPTEREALGGPDAALFRAAKAAEVKQLEDRGAWELVHRSTLPPNTDVLYNKTVYRKKTVDPGDGSSAYDKHKARVTIGGNKQQKGINYSKTWSPVVKFAVMRMLLAFAMTYGYQVYQLDFDGAYLNGTIDTDVYMQQVKGFERDGPSGEPASEMVCKLRKSLYGLKQAGRIWYHTLRSHLCAQADTPSQGFICTRADTCVFVRHRSATWVVCMVYVDDLLVFSNNAQAREDFIQHLGGTFKITDKGLLQYYLGINFTSTGTRGTMDQKKYIQENLEHFGLHKANPRSTPLSNKPHPDPAQPLTENDAATYRSMVGVLVYLLCTRPDIAHAVSWVTRHMHAPTTHDMLDATTIWQYLQHTKDKVLTFSTMEPNMHMYTDSNFGGCPDTGRSQTAYVLFMFGAAVAWKSCRQPVVALSTSEAEYMAMCAGAMEVLFFRGLLEELSIPQLAQSTPHTIVLCDNQAAIKMADEGADNTRTKHIHRKYMFLKELTEGDLKQVAPSYVQSNSNFADGLTKRLSKGLQTVSMRRLLGHDNQ
jgi:hypothetical protein